ncbi:MAG: hypothetical protein ACRD0K_22505 [Egibacteraceae bacterium]
MTEIAAAVAIVGAVLGSAWCCLEWRAKLTPEVRGLMVEMRESLVAEDRNSSWLLDVARRQEQQLEELIDRVNDRKLRRGCNEVLKRWRDVRSRARAGSREGAVEVWHVMDTKAAIATVLSRVNTLERLLPPRH